MCDVRVNWTPEGLVPHTGVFKLIDDESLLSRAKRAVDEPHLWFMARGGEIFGIPSKTVLSIMAVRDG